MSSQHSWSEADIHAYVDGALDAVTAARLAADSQRDAALDARIAHQKELRDRLRAELAPVLEEPVPQRLLDALAGATAGAATPIGTARTVATPRARPAWSAREWTAVAASLVVGILAGQQIFRGSGDVPIEAEQGRFVATGYLSTALTAQISGAAPEGTKVRIGLSFLAAEGEYCRTFSLQAGPSGLACRRDGNWSVDLLDGTGSAEDPESFRQASSALSPAILGAITARGSSEPLTAEEEQQRVASGWDAVQ